MSGKSPIIKIALLGTFPPTKGGIATNLNHLVKSPLKQKYDFLKFQTMSKKQGSMDYFQEKIWMKLIRVVSEVLLFFHFLQIHRPRLVHINSSFGPWSFWRDSAYLVICRFMKKKVLMQFHGGNLEDFLGSRSEPKRRMVQKMVALPDRIAVCSEKQKQPFHAIGIGHKVTVLRNMVNLNPHGKDKSFRHQLSIPMDSFIVLFVSAQFFSQKGIMEVIQAIPRVQSRNPKAVFVLAGGGSADQDLLNRLKEMEENGRIVMTGHLDYPRMQRLFAASDCLILPSHAEGLPLALLEAMAAGLPVIATPVGGIPEAVQEGINGFLIPIGDAAALADRIDRLIRRSRLRKQMEKANIQKIEECFRVDIVAQQYDSLYRSLLLMKEMPEPCR